MEKKIFSKRRTRVNAILMLYSYDFHNTLNKKDFIKNCAMIINDLDKYDQDNMLIKFIDLFFEHNEKIDFLINDLSDQWSFEKISLINKTILRVCFLETLFFNEKIPIIINEYIEIAKIYGGNDDYKYIHLMLGKLNDWRNEEKNGRV